MLYKATQIPSLMDVDVVILRSAKLWAYESEGKIRCDTCRIHNICSLSRLFSLFAILVARPLSINAQIFLISP